jgi:hypothetical protein
VQKKTGAHSMSGYRFVLKRKHNYPDGLSGFLLRLLTKRMLLTMTAPAQDWT